MRTTLEAQLRGARELRRRVAARKGFIPYCHFVTPWFQSPPHVQYLAPFLEAVEEGVIDRLMIREPPRHGKTSAGTHHLARYISRFPSEDLVLGSYNAQIVENFSGLVQGILDRPESALLCDRNADWSGGTFGTARKRGSDARDLWKTVHGGTVRAVGLKGGSGGFGANGLYLDDMYKNREEADSDIVRRRVAEVYSGVLYPRMMPRPNGLPAWIIMTYTPWHENDLAQEELAAMLRSETGDRWWVVTLPAVAEDNDLMGRMPGEALWPERYPRKSLDRIKAVLDRINPRDWPALYQCRPAALEGTYFKREWFLDLIAAVGRRRYWLTTDWGTGKGDATVHQVWSVDQAGNVELVERWYRVCDTDQGTDAALDYVAKYEGAGGIAAWIYAKGPIDRAVTPLVLKKMEERKIFCPIENYAETTSKEEKALTIQGRLAAGRVHVPHRAPWFADFLRKVLAFPSSADDNDVDAMAMFGLHLNKAVAPPPTDFAMQTAQADDALW